ncbi:hypothetical protein Cni_G09876 [Canna indica]|uniref:Pentatricopeptide repeat-containing protein n=1 Tax=Canna indica TaxID=4628 RepID=A0AAQ3K3D5_9LILI|nr:hypothetical protein Cni_G09876 [Canna indica]
MSPNAYTFTVLVKGLVKDRWLPKVRKYLLEMMGRGIRPNAGTYLTVFEAYLLEQKVDDARALLKEMRAKGFEPNEKIVRVNLGKRDQVFRGIFYGFFYELYVQRSLRLNY